MASPGEGFPRKEPFLCGRTLTLTGKHREKSHNSPLNPRWTCHIRRDRNGFLFFLSFFPNCLIHKQRPNRVDVARPDLACGYRYSIDLIDGAENSFYLLSDDRMHLGCKALGFISPLWILWHGLFIQVRSGCSARAGWGPPQTPRHGRIFGHCLSLTVRQGFRTDLFAVPMKRERPCLRCARGAARVATLLRREPCGLRPLRTDGPTLTSPSPSVSTEKGSARR